MHNCQISPQKLLLILFTWILPYIFVANYLERSLLPFRALCYTQPDLLQTHNFSSLNACIRKHQPSRDASLSCHLNKRPGTLLEPKYKTKFKRMIVIRSAPTSLDYRSYIRETWKTHIEEIPVVFVTAKKEGLDLKSEADGFNDILQFNFTDSYHNLSYKMMSIYGYVLEEHPQVEEIVVINDDTIVNATALRMLKYDDADKPWVLGKVSRGYPRLWMPWLTWHVDGTMYPNMCYPRFVQGSSFIVSRGAARAVFDNICQFPFVHLDDIFMGVMCDCLGIKQIHNDGFDHHTFDSFVVFHYQYSRYTADYLRSLWKGSQFDM